MGDLEHHVDRMIRYWLIREATLKRLAESAPLSSQQTEMTQVQCQVLFEKRELNTPRRRW